MQLLVLPAVQGGQCDLTLDRQLVSRGYSRYSSSSSGTGEACTSWVMLMSRSAAASSRLTVCSRQRVRRALFSSTPLQKRCGTRVKPVMVTSGRTRTYSFRAVTAWASTSSRRPVAQMSCDDASCRSSAVQAKGTDTARLRSPALSSEVYSTVTRTVPETVTRSSDAVFSRMYSCPQALTIRVISGQYSAMAVSIVSSWLTAA